MNAVFAGLTTVEEVVRETIMEVSRKWECGMQDVEQTTLKIGLLTSSAFPVPIIPTSEFANPEHQSPAARSSRTCHAHVSIRGHGQ